MYMRGASDGWIHGNRFFWRCSMMDLDVSDRVVFEDNTIECTESKAHHMELYFWLRLLNSSI